MVARSNASFTKHRRPPGCRWASVFILTASLTLNMPYHYNKKSFAAQRRTTKLREYKI